MFSSNVRDDGVAALRISAPWCAEECAHPTCNYMVTKAPEEECRDFLNAIATCYPQSGNFPPIEPPPPQNV